LFIGPVFFREAATLPRRPRHYIYRAVYVTALLILMCTAWLVLTGTQVVRNVGDMARFGSLLFQILAPLQLALAVFLSALHAASGVSQEKDRMTLILLMMTRLNNSELVLGKLMASLLNVLSMLAAGLPVFMLTVLFGGVSFSQVAQVFIVTLCASLAAGSIGSIVALWREKTFQTLALTALILVFWMAGAEGINYASVALGKPLLSDIATAISPLKAIVAACEPQIAGDGAALLPSGVASFVLFSLALTAVLNLTAMWKVRVWNPSREVRIAPTAAEQMSIWGAEHDMAVAMAAPGGVELAEAARAGHVDARVRSTSVKSRRVWDNPVLWREVCTWAYGRKVVLIRIAYLFLAAMAAAGLYAALGGSQGAYSGDEAVIPAAALPLAPFFLVSLVIVNALAVTSITHERDGAALDLLLVTDLTPREFVLGKLGGVLWVTREMVLGPLVLCGYLWLRGALDAEHFTFLAIGLLVMNVFVAVLGIHTGMIYANSRSAIGVSLGTVFFLFLGVATCIVMMISFSGSFQTQLAPFLAFIVGGGVGLYASLGSRNPSTAILVTSIVLPFATFHAITSYLLEHTMTVFLVTTGAYGFATAAMLVPAMSEFDIAMGRTKTAEEEG
jgi:hypothetical protein